MSTPQVVSILVTCPVESCRKEKSFEIPKFLFDNKQTDFLALPVHKQDCCEHEFIVFISNHGTKVSGYELIDTVVDISKLYETSQAKKFFLESLLSKYGTLATSAILRAIILDMPICILRNESEKNLSSKIFNLLIQFIPEEYQNQMIKISHIFQSGFKEAEIENTLVISSTGIIVHTPWESISDNYERNLINEALKILDLEFQSIIIKEELRKILDKAKFINEIIEKKEIFENDLKIKINKRFHVSISNLDFKLLKQIVSVRFGQEISKIKIKSLTKISEGLW